MKEVWRDIPGYEGYYQASNLGNIKSLPKKYKPLGRILKPQQRNNYLIVSLSRDGKSKSQSVHRIIMKTFKGESNLTVNHIDGNKHNNKLENLEYCTPRDNSRHVFISKIKTTNTEKFKDEIIKDYKNGVTLTKLTKKYHVDLRHLKMFLLENGFELKERRTGKYPKIINRKIIKEVKIMYEKNPEISNKEISERTGLSGSSVTRIMQEIC